MNYYNENDPKAAAWLQELIKQQRIPNGFVDPRSITDVDPSDLEQYAQCHFFAGIGGWSYALQLADWPTDRQVWTGSCPCQPFSIAGKGLGEDDARHLWPVFYHLIAQCGPPVVFGEQVASKAGKLWLARVRADLEALGYGVGAGDLCAAGVGAPHIRQRLYWVAAHRIRLNGMADRDSRGCRAPGSSGPASEEPNSQHSRSSGGVAEPGQQHSGRGDTRPGQGSLAHEERPPSQSGRPNDSSGLANAERDGRWSNKPQWGKEGRATDGRPCRLADLQQQGLEGYPGDGGGRDEPRRIEEIPIGSAPQSRSSGGMDNPTNYRTLLAGSAEPCLDWANDGVSRKTSGMGDTESGGCGVVRDETLARNSGHTVIPSWSRFELIWCRDNKARRIESGTFPLAYGVPGRVGLLRGYGNAIVPALAAEFVKAYLTI